jgi:peptidoglycan/LPS O-acetylase OafA/YrhL
VSDPRYKPQLDSLRTLAVFGVMIEHYIPGSDWIRGHIPCGALGVRLFFVLSGYLITGILFRSRLRLDASDQSLKKILKNFFARRFIRLMPVYYVYLLAVALTMPFARPYLWAFVLYLQNFLFAARPELFAKMLAHFWSLAVEEQFYLTWPFIILLVPRRYLLATVSVFIVAGPLSRIVGLAAGFLPLQIDLMMPSHFDTLGLGGLLAILQLGDANDRNWGERLTKLGLFIGAPLTVASIVAEDLQFGEFKLIFSELGMGLLFSWVVVRAADGFQGVIGGVLNFEPLQYLGKISYGLYVYHFNVPGLLRDKIAPHLGIDLPESAWLKLLIYACVTVVLASASSQWLEKPINRLKTQFS